MSEHNVKSFNAIIGDAPHSLILGTAPSVDSLRQQQYYGHARNAFWPIVLSLLTKKPMDKNHLSVPYAEKVSLLKTHGIALWDVFASCHRNGSLDSAITPSSVEMNAIDALLLQHPSIVHVYCNGHKALSSFQKFIVKANPHVYNNIKVTLMPSTSPAHASLSFEKKWLIWQQNLAFLHQKNASK